MTPSVAALLLALCFTVGATSDACAAAAPVDPLEPMLHRIDAFLHRGEVGGVTPDLRNLLNPPEQIRLSIVPQLLAYCELYRAHSLAAHYEDIVSRADFLVAHLDALTSKTAADGLMGYALLSAYEITGDARYREGAAGIVQQMLELQGFGLQLNWGLMAALTLAKHHQLEGDPQALTLARRIVWGVACMQNADGGMPHVCPGSRDVHYTAWMSMELIRLDPLLGDALIPRMLIRTHAFMQARVDAGGSVSYQDSPAPAAVAYYPPANGCSRDYDTREWVNELGYDALLFDHFGDPRYRGVMERLLGLEDHGAFPDKWGSLPSPEDPIYPWASSSRSVIRTSLVFWSLASTYADREQRGSRRGAESRVAGVLPEAEQGDALSVIQALGGAFPFSAEGVFLGEAVPDTIPAAPETWVVDGNAGAPTSSANPTVRPSGGSPNRVLSLSLAQISPRDLPDIRFSLGRPCQVSLRIYDLGGRAVRELWGGGAEAGEHRVAWDGRDDAGRGAPSGVYIVRLATSEGVRSARFFRLR